MLNVFPYCYFRKTTSKLPSANQCIEKLSPGGFSSLNDSFAYSSCSTFLRNSGFIIYPKTQKVNTQLKINQRQRAPHSGSSHLFWYLIFYYFYHSKQIRMVLNDRQIETPAIFNPLLKERNRVSPFSALKHFRN